MNSPSFVGIDIGSQTALIAVAKKGGVEILANEASQRETPVVVGFGDYERFIGELGYAQVYLQLLSLMNSSNPISRIPSNFLCDSWVSLRILPC